MGLILRNNTIVKNLRVGPLSGGGSGGGGGGSVQFAMGAGYWGPGEGRVYLFDPTNLSSPSNIISNPYGSTRGGSFGRGGVAIDGTSLVVPAGAQQDAGGNAYGSLFVYDVSNLSSTPTELQNPTTETGMSLGEPTIMSSDYIVAAARFSNAAAFNAGAVFVWDRSNLSASPTILTANDAAASDYFGHGVAFSSNHLIVGAPDDDDQGTSSGGLYFYDVTNLSANPTKVSTAGSSKLGVSIAADGNTVVVGASGNGGALYVYDASNLSSAPTQLIPSSIQANDIFGYATAITANHIIGGAPLDNVTASYAGAVYVYDRSNLSATPTVLRPSDGAANDYFGQYIAANGNHLIVSSTGAEGNSLNNIGAVYVYDLSNLSAAPTKLQPTSLTDGSGMGFTVAIG